MSKGSVLHQCMHHRKIPCIGLLRLIQILNLLVCQQCRRYTLQQSAVQLRPAVLCYMSFHVFFDIMMETCAFCCLQVAYPGTLQEACTTTPPTTTSTTPARWSASRRISSATSPARSASRQSWGYAAPKVRLGPRWTLAMHHWGNQLCFHCFVQRI